MGNLHKLLEEARLLTERELSYSAYERDAKISKFTFRTAGMMALWQEELTGQISDGAWENSANTHWQYWGSIPCFVGGSTKVTGVLNAWPKRSFDFARELPEYVGDRMLQIVQKVEPRATMEVVIEYCKEMQKAISVFIKEGGQDVPDAPTTDQWVIVVPETVLGNSTGPAGFDRFKPYPYSKAGLVHKIVYAYVFNGGTKQDAENEANRAFQFMSRLQPKANGDVVWFKVVLWNVKDDQVNADWKSGTGANPDELFPGVTCSNALLKQWGVL